MVTLQENAVKFNSNLSVSHDGGRLSSDSGLILIDELMDAFQFTQLSKKIFDLTTAVNIGHTRTLRF